MAQSPTDAKDVIIEPLRLRNVHEAQAVFVEALMNHFDYFDDTYKQMVLAQHQPEHLVRTVLHRRRFMLVAKLQGRIIGYVIGSVPRDGRGQIYWLFVDPNVRGRNIGLMLLSRILRAMQRKGATEAQLVTHDHAKYYARQGFRLVKKIKNGTLIEYVLAYTFPQ